MSTDILKDMAEAQEEINAEAGSTGDAGPVSTPAASAGTASDASNEASAGSEGAGDGEGDSSRAAGGGRARDASGRFAKSDSAAPKQLTLEAKPQEAEAKAPEPVDPAAAIVPEVKPPEQVAMKAPQSWKPAAREAWAKLPPEAQQEVLRREKEMATGLQELAPVRKFKAEFEQVVSPYISVLQASGTPPIQAIGNLLQTASALQMGTGQQKAAVVASIIKSYGVDVESLAAALDGQGGPVQQAAAVDPDAIARQVRERVLQQIQQQRQSALTEGANRELEEFSQKAEFLEDLRPRMRRLMLAALEDGEHMSLQQAYDLAASTHPEISGIMKQREEAKAVANARASTQRTRDAASSIKGQPTGQPPDETDGSILGDLKAAAAAIGRR